MALTGQSIKRTVNRILIYNKRICYFNVTHSTKQLRSTLGSLFFSGATAPSGSWPPHSRGVYTTHDAPYSVGLL